MRRSTAAPKPNPVFARLYNALLRTYSKIMHATFRVAGGVAYVAAPISAGP
jgi:hypothetical protein